MPLNHHLLRNNVRLRAISEGAFSMKETKPADDPDAVERIQKALTRLGFAVPLTRVFDTKTWLAVGALQRVVFPNNPKEWDGRVGQKTIAEIDERLFRPPTPMPLSDPKDILVFISGVSDVSGLGGVRMSAEDLGKQAMEFAQVRREGRGTHFFGFGGSLRNSIGVELLVEAIDREFDPTSKIIMYGYSAGGKQLLEACERLNFRNVGRRAAGKPLIAVDLLVTNDAAADKQNDSVKRMVASCVRRNANFFQTAAPPGFPSRGGRNTPGPAQEGGKQCEIRPEEDMTNEAVGAAALVGASTPHGHMQTLAHPRAMREIRAEMAAVRVGLVATMSR